MASHIYARLGSYGASIECNERAIAIDEEYARHGASAYLPGHNIEMLVYSAALSARRESAHRYSAKLGHGALLASMLRFGEHAAILARVAAQPCATAEPLCHYAHGMAVLAADGGDHEETRLTAARASLHELDDGSHCGCIQSATGQLGLPPCAWDNAVTCIARWTLGARLALAEGDTPRSIRLMQLAVEREANLAYDEPPPWHYPSRHCLGALELLAATEPHKVVHDDPQARAAAARRAEAVYVADLEVWPENAWSTIGLAAARQAQPAAYSAAHIEALWARAPKLGRHRQASRVHVVPCFCGGAVRASSVFVDGGRAVRGTYGVRVRATPGAWCRVERSATANALPAHDRSIST